MTHLFVHYHQRPGGVTRVLQQEASEFSKGGISFASLSAGPAAVMGEHRIIPLLDYASDQQIDEAALWESLLAAASDFPRPWVWHIHNPTLGCHPTMAAIVQRLARENERLILHLHDFAEDARPLNTERLREGSPWFPCGARIHYAVLTKRDRDILRRAGLPESQVTLIGNPITPQPISLPNCDDAFVVYPTRAITRKNIGEMLLLAAIAPAGTTFATTLSPGSSRYQQEYQHWQQVADRLALPIEWAIAEMKNCSLVDIIAHSTHLLSTATQEGFGMAFLESIAWQRPLIGRAIPHIQENLASYHIAHPFLYDAILVDGIDFAKQTAVEQTTLIQRAQSHPELVMIHLGNNFLDAQEWLQKALSPAHRPLPLSLLDPFHPQRHAETISAIAQSLLHAPVSAISQLNAESIQRSFSA